MNFQTCSGGLQKRICVCAGDKGICRDCVLAGVVFEEAVEFLDVLDVFAVSDFASDFFGEFVVEDVGVFVGRLFVALVDDDVSVYFHKIVAVLF